MIATYQRRYINKKERAVFYSRSKRLPIRSTPPIHTSIVMFLKVLEMK